MAEARSYGRKRPNGEKIAQLRREKGIKQADFAGRAKISERLLREIERRNHSVLSTTITSIAAALMVSPDNIVLSTPDARSTKLTIAPGVGQGRSRFLLRLLVVRSATELNNLAEDTAKYKWALTLNASS
jgi:transcriptional regulator with XRE-family HTH domain